ncbi:FHA domain-containing protein [Planctomycetota bacterium]
MQVRVEKPGQPPKPYHFDAGTIHIGRHSDCQIQLDGKAVSRQHAIIYLNLEGKAIIKDLDSANGTYLNHQPVCQETLKNGDSLQIGDFRLDILLEEPTSSEDDPLLDDTAFITDPHVQRVVREPRAQDGPDITLPCHRLTDFTRSIRSLHLTSTPNHLLQTLLVLLLQQFRPSRVWCGLREETEGLKAYSIGTTDRGQPVNFESLDLKYEISRVIETGTFLLLPNTTHHSKVKLPGSAMIVPLPQQYQNLGAIYLDRTADWKPFALQDLDYLILLSIEAAAVITGMVHRPIDATETPNEPQ